MNVTELLAGLQARHDETTARAAELRDQMQHLTAALAETEARLAEASVNITRSRLGRLTRQGFLTQPGRGRYQKRT
ncbi:hypothetical protein KZO11_38225 [Streptomyces anulatus]|uniref:hypothetical protein n=1 Tax=Streptomyces anulatus TaxID=1892 RepID=UPI001C600089|nr:hypothetical protein [Streptomyces anulatus]QYA98977.1 hypothetical protein KZO11_38225 [Streptomyces anulatus]